MIKVGDFLGAVVGRLDEHDIPPQVVSLTHVNHHDEELIIGLIQDDQGWLFLLHHIRGGQLYQLGVFPIELDGERYFLDMRALKGLRSLRKQELAHMQGLWREQGEIDWGVGGALDWLKDLEIQRRVIRYREGYQMRGRELSHLAIRLVLELTDKEPCVTLAERDQIGLC